MVCHCNGFIMLGGGGGRGGWLLFIKQFFKCVETTTFATLKECCTAMLQWHFLPQGLSRREHAEHVLAQWKALSASYKC